MLSTPIINPPQSAILGIHATKDRAVVENGQVVFARSTTWPCPTTTASSTAAKAVLGLVTMKEALEDPARCCWASKAVGRRALTPRVRCEACRRLFPDP